MGFYSFYYHLKQFLRRMPKKLLVAFCIFLIVCIAHLKGYCYTESYILNYSGTDIVQAYRLEYDTNFYRFVREAITLGTRNGGQLPSQLKTTFAQMSGADHFKMNIFTSDYGNTFVYENGQLLNMSDYSIGLFITTGNASQHSTYTYEDTRYSSTVEYCQFMTSYYSNGRIVTINLNNHTYTNSTTSNRAWIIDAYDTYIPNELYNIIYDLGNGLFDFNMAQTTLTTIDNHIQELNEETENMNDFLQDDTVDNYTQNDLPQSNITDPTESTFNGIFNRLYTAISNDSYHSVTIPLKFGQWDKSFSLNSNSLDFMRGDRNRDLVAFIELIWSFIIYYYILRDIYNMVNDLSQGKIAEKVDNIKTQLL